MHPVECVVSPHAQAWYTVGKSLFAKLALGGRSFEYVLDLSGNSRQNWEMGGQSIVGPLSRHYGIMMILALVKFLLSLSLSQL